MVNVFAYGSLMFSDVLFAVTGAWMRSESAAVRGHCVYAVKGKSYPALLRLPAGVAQGRLYRGISAAQLKRLDAFEGTWYVRRRVHVLTAQGRTVAFAYAWHPAQRNRVAPAGWDDQAFAAYRRRRFAAHWRRRRRRSVSR